MQSSSPNSLRHRLFLATVCFFIALTIAVCLDDYLHRPPVQKPLTDEHLRGLRIDDLSHLTCVLGDAALPDLFAGPVTLFFWHPHVHESCLALQNRLAEHTDDHFVLIASSPVLISDDTPPDFSRPDPYHMEAPPEKYILPAIDAYRLPVTVVWQDSENLIAKTICRHLNRPDLWRGHTFPDAILLENGVARPKYGSRE